MARSPPTIWLWPKSPDDPELCGSNVHMESRDSSDPFAFDYLLKPGVSTHSNALAIADWLAWRFSREPSGR